MRAALFLEYKADVGYKDTGVETASLPEMWAGGVWEVQQQALQLPCHGLRVPGPGVRLLLRLHQGRGSDFSSNLS